MCACVRACVIVRARCDRAWVCTCLCDRVCVRESYVCVIVFVRACVCRQLSTSQSPLVQLHLKLPSGHMTRGGGFGPVAFPGIGCSYHILPERIYFNVSARVPADPEAEAARFGASLRDALDGMQALLMANPAPRD